MKFSVATQNIWGRVPLWPWRCRAIAHSLAGVDVAVLQEVQARRKGGSQAHDLARQMGMPHAHFASAGKTLGWREGVGVISRFPIRHAAWERLSQTRHPIDAIAPRPVLRVVVETPAGLLEVYGVHLSLARRARTQGAGEIISFARRQRAILPATYTVLAGDFNATSAEPWRNSLRVAAWWTWVRGAGVAGRPIQRHGRRGGLTT